jgi:hypothetical protein
LILVPTYRELHIIIGKIYFAARLINHHQGREAEKISPRDQKENRKEELIGERRSEMGIVWKFIRYCGRERETLCVTIKVHSGSRQ